MDRYVYKIIINYLNIYQQLKCRLVCRAWRDMLSPAALWENYVPRRFTGKFAWKLNLNLVILDDNEFYSFDVSNEFLYYKKSSSYIFRKLIWLNDFYVLTRQTDELSLIHDYTGTRFAHIHTKLTPLDLYRPNMLTFDLNDPELRDFWFERI